MALFADIAKAQTSDSLVSIGFVNAVRAAPGEARQLTARNILQPGFGSQGFGAVAGGCRSQSIQ